MYGRRIFENQPKHEYKKRKFRILNKAFQYKYTGYLVASVGISLFFIVLPIYFYTNQNYKVFVDLALESQRDLISHLEREISWLNIFLFLSTAASLVFCAMIGIRLTYKLLSPLNVLQGHMRKVTEGDWSVPALKSRANDEFRELISTYGYLYKSLKANSEKEIKIIEKFNIDPNNREIFNMWKTLIKNKKQQLGLQVEIKEDVFVDKQTNVIPLNYSDKNHKKSKLKQKHVS